MDVVVGPLGTRQPSFFSLPSPVLEVSRPIVHLLGFRAGPQIPTSDVCLKQASKMVGFSLKIVKFSFKMVDFNVKMAGFSFKMAGFSFKMAGFSFKIGGFSFKIAGFSFFSFKTVDFCFKTAGFSCKMASFSFKMAGLGFKIVDFSFKMADFSFKMVDFSFKSTICSFWLARVRLARVRLSPPGFRVLTFLIERCCGHQGLYERGCTPPIGAKPCSCTCCARP